MNRIVKNILIVISMTIVIISLIAVYFRVINALKFGIGSEFYSCMEYCKEFVPTHDCFSEICWRMLNETN